MSFNILDYLDKLEHINNNCYKCIICNKDKFKSKS